MISLIIPAYFANQELVDMTTKCIKSQKENVQLVLVADNSPYTTNVNSGLRAATGDVIVVGNNDLVFHDTWLTELLFPLELGFDVSTMWTSDQKVELEDRIEKNGKFGSIFAMKRYVYETIGGFDEQFGGYFSDDDYRERILSHEFIIGKNLSAVLEHQAKATYDVTDKDDFEFKRSKILFERKYGYAD